jgi:hypothetical protein
VTSWRSVGCRMEPLWTHQTLQQACGSTRNVNAISDAPECPACPFFLGSSQHLCCSGAGTCIHDACICECDPGLTDVVCGVPESVCAFGVLSEGRTCCEGGLVEASGRCWDVHVGADGCFGQCCLPPVVIDACGSVEAPGLWWLKMANAARFVPAISYEFACSYP